MKRIFYLFYSFFLVLSFSISAKTALPSINFDTANITQEHIAYAQQWVTVLFDDLSVLRVEEEDLQIILNVLYFSAIRSQINIQAQETALEALNKMWEGWSNVIAHRRNPSKPIIHTHATVDVTRIAELHEKNLIAHEKLCTLYDIALEQTINNGILENHFLLNHLNFMRDHVRRIMLQAAANVKSELDMLAKYIQAKKIVLEEDENGGAKSNFIEYLFDSLPVWTYQSFIIADKLFVKTSELNWSALHTANTVTNHIWEKLEIARGSFYTALYQEAYHQAELHGIKPMFAFNEHGLIPTSKRKIALPRPQFR